ncbi:MAG: DUF5320 domain-containing protein [Victivallales bacterium]|nr:DUF5320 domain-containing protein [Victivallales bacterium]
MPRGDGTGPSGMGPMTGRGAGFCAGYEVPGFMNSGCGRGFGGRGGGRGWRNMYHATGVPGRARGGWGAQYGAMPYPQQAPVAQDEKEYLDNCVKGLEAELSEVRKRLEEISKESK